MIACASTVAVVVPSPATSEVLQATSLTIWAPTFSMLSSSSISLATLTPSLVIVGSAKFLLEDDIAALGAEGHLDRVGERVDAALETRAGIGVEGNFLDMGGVWKWGIGDCVVDMRDEAATSMPNHPYTIILAHLTTPKMSDSRMIIRSSPSICTSLPAYLP